MLGPTISLLPPASSTFGAGSGALGGLAGRAFAGTIAGVALDEFAAEGAFVGRGTSRLNRFSPYFMGLSLVDIREVAYSFHATPFSALLRGFSSGSGY
jgi:hypothetical protein